MRVVVVDPKDRTVTTQDVEDKLETFQRMVGGTITGVYPGNFHPEFERVHGYVDDEGLYTKTLAEHGAFAMFGYDGLMGPAVFMGSTRSGGNTDCPVTAEQVAKHVRWIVGRW